MYAILFFLFISFVCLRRSFSHCLCRVYDTRVSSSIFILVVNKNIFMMFGSGKKVNTVELVCSCGTLSRIDDSQHCCTVTTTTMMRTEKRSKIHKPARTHIGARKFMLTSELFDGNSCMTKNGHFFPFLPLARSQRCFFTDGKWSHFEVFSIYRPVLYLLDSFFLSFQVEAQKS